LQQQVTVYSSIEIYYYTLFDCLRRYYFVLFYISQVLKQNGANPSIYQGLRHFASKLEYPCSCSLLSDKQETFVRTLSGHGRKFSVCFQRNIQELRTVFTGTFIRTTRMNPELKSDMGNLKSRIKRPPGTGAG
jgi:hypothetical protein